MSLYRRPKVSWKCDMETTMDGFLPKTPIEWSPSSYCVLNSTFPTGSWIVPFCRGPICFHLCVPPLCPTFVSTFVSTSVAQLYLKKTSLLVSSCTKPIDFYSFVLFGSFWLITPNKMETSSNGCLTLEPNLMFNLCIVGGLSATGSYWSLKGWQSDQHWILVNSICSSCNLKTENRKNWDDHGVLLLIWLFPLALYALLAANQKSTNQHMDLLH